MRARARARAADARAGVRLALLRAVLVAAFLLLAGRAAHLALVDPRGGDRAVRQTRASLLLAPARGLVVDRSGKELAVSADAPSVYASPDSVGNPAVAARSLARVLGRDRGRLERRLRGSGSFAFLARWVSEEQARRVEALSLPGVGVVREPRRAYPAGPLAAPVLGFANIDGRGVRGVEQQEDGWLAGTAQRVFVERDARGRLLAGSDAAEDGTRGGDVMLTFDAALQAATEEALAEAVRRSRARGGVAVVLEPGSGAVLALAEHPSFDPNRFREVPYARTRSRAFLDAWEPGSTLKAFLAAAALEQGAVAAHDLIDCEEGAYRVPGKTIRDARPFGLLPLDGVLRVSSNVGAVKLAERLGPEAHYRGLRAFGFGNPTGSGFPDESSGLLRSWRDWRPVDHATIAFGQGVAVTPVQLAAAAAALANGGVWVTPRVVAARRPPGGSWRALPPGPRRRAVSEGTASEVLRMMAGVVEDGGTGRLAGLRGVPVAGKTGTAQKLDPETGTYAHDRYVAWFLGAAPADRPVLVAVVGLDEPRGPAHSGGAVAAPLFARIAAAHLASWGIITEPEPAPRRETDDETLQARAEAAEEAAPPARPAPEPRHPRAARTARTPRAPLAEGTDGTARSERDEPTRVAAAVRPADPPAPTLEPIATIESGASEEPRVLLPDFHGLTVAEVQRLGHEARLDVEITGRGRAVSQEPGPGTILSGGDRRVRVSFATGGGEG